MLGGSGTHLARTVQLAGVAKFTAARNALITARVTRSGNYGTDCIVEDGFRAPAAAQETNIFPSASPAMASSSDAAAVELGLQFRSQTAGKVTAIRFWRGAGSNTTFTVNLYSGSTRVATGTYTDTATAPAGWRTMRFSSPVNIQAATTYTASYHAPIGGYAMTNNALASAVTSGSLMALANGGVFRYGGSGTVPTEVFNASNYFVDVAFTP